MWATLPQSIEIDGVVHVQHWRSRDLVIYQNYDERPTLRDDGQPGLVFRSDKSASMFQLYRITRLNPGEELGEKIASYTSLDAAMNRARQEETVQ